MDGEIEVPLVDGEVRMQIVDGQVYANTIQVTDGGNIQITLDPSQHNYSAPIPAEQFIIQGTSGDNQEVVVQNSSHVELTQDTHTAGDDDVEDAQKDDVIQSYLVQNIKQEDLSHFALDPIAQSISHHDYIGSVPVPQIIQKQEMPSSNIPDSLQENDGGLVIEEAVEEEISTSQTLEDEEIVRSKPLTAMYLQRKEVGIMDTVFIPSHHHQSRTISPSKSPGSSKFTLRPSSRAVDLGYGDLPSVEDVKGMRLSYNDPISVYHPNTGEIHFKVDNSGEEEPKRSLTPQRSVGAILAASEAIKHQDIASEVEIGTCEVEISPPKKGRKKKEKDRKGGIDDDIEQIRKAAKNVAFTLYGMKDGKDGRKRRKPRIRLTLTKSKSRRLTPNYSEEEMEYESSNSSPKGKRGRKRKAEFSEKNGVPNIIYQCEYCEKQFKTREKVRVHTKIHTEERAFNCDVCGSQFRRREHLIRHYRRHTNDRPFQCLECGKTYMRAEHLKRHSYDHSGEKPFECPICPKAFTRHDRLIKHSLVHDK